jgi:signal transduction histidine kinase
MRREGQSFDLYTWGQEYAQVSPGMAHAIIIDPDGKRRTTTREPHPNVIDLGDRDHFRVHRDGQFRGLYIGQTVIGRIQDLPALPISRRVEAADGTFLGVVAVLLPPSALTALHKSINLGPHGTLALAGLDNVVRARFSADSPDGNTGIGALLSGAPRPDFIEEGAEGWFTRIRVIDGITRLYTYGRLGNYPLVVTVGLDLDQKLAASRSHAATIVAIALGSTLLLAGLAAYLIREMRIRAAHEVNLAEERTKLLATNVALTESKERAETADRAKSEFLTNMSHELRTPLNAVLGFSEVMVSEAFGPLGNDRYRSYARDIHLSGTHLLEIINGILDLSKAASGKLELIEGWFDARDVANSVCRLIQPRLDEAKLSLAVNMLPGDLIIYADERLVKQMLLNLLANACKFTPPNGRIEFSILVDASGLQFAVTDTGIGIAAEDLERVVQPFVQVDSSLSRQHEGTGLGLALVKMMAELHGGSLHLESKVGHGTTAVIILPLSRLQHATTDISPGDATSSRRPERMIV